MSVTPELLNVRDRQMMMAEATLRKVKSLISVPELYRRDEATETLMKIFIVVNGYVEDMMAFQAVDEALEESSAELNMQQQQQQQQQQQTQLPIAASPAIEHAAATAAAAAAAAAAADDSQL